MRTAIITAETSLESFPFRRRAEPLYRASHCTGARIGNESAICTIELAPTNGSPSRNLEMKVLIPIAMGPIVGSAGDSGPVTAVGLVERADSRTLATSSSCMIRRLARISSRAVSKGET